MLEITDGLEIEKNVSLAILLDSRLFEEDEKNEEPDGYGEEQTSCRVGTQTCTSMRYLLHHPRFAQSHRCVLLSSVIYVVGTLASNLSLARVLVDPGWRTFSG